MSADKLATYVASLYDALLLAWLDTPEWHAFKEATEKLARALDSYLSYLRSQNKKMQIHHDSPGISVAAKTSVQLLKPNKTPPGLLRKLNDAISHKAPYEFF